jgi:hypothetical protein
LREPADLDVEAAFVIQGSLGHVERILENPLQAFDVFPFVFPEGLESATLIN